MDGSQHISCSILDLTKGPESNFLVEFSLLVISLLRLSLQIKSNHNFLTYHHNQKAHSFFLQSFFLGWNEELS